ncbi:retrotransposon protein, putative, ty1-copia subclass [Tanacetum coccineum]
MFKTFQNEVENQLGKTIKALQSDQGGEYLSQEFLDHLKSRGIISQLTPPYMPQHNEASARILNMVPIKKVNKTPYEIWHGKVSSLSYLKFWGCPKETMGYYFYYPPENKIFVARYAEFFENNLISREASGSTVKFDEIQRQDTQPSENTSEHQPEEHELGDHGEHTNYQAALSDPESDKWLEAINVEIQSMKDKSWNKRFDEEIKKYGFTQNHDEPCVYMRASGSIVVFLILYVNDILLMGNNIPMLQDVKSWLGKSFSMKDLGEAAYILGIKIYRDRSRRVIGLCQNAYIDKILKQFKMDASKRGSLPMQPNVQLSKTQGPSTPTEVKRMKGVPYASVVGSIMYAYLRDTKYMFLVYDGDSTTDLCVTCYTDAGWETDWDDLRSQTGYVFVMNRGVVDCKSSKQSTTAMSSTEAEYIAASEAAIEAI